MVIRKSARAIALASLVFQLGCGSDDEGPSNASLYNPVLGADAGVMPNSGDAGDGNGNPFNNSGNGGTLAPGDGNSANPGNGDSLGGGDGDAAVAAFGDAASGDGDSQSPGAGYVRGPAPTVDSASKAGPYHVESYTDGFRNGPDYADATIFYPTDAEPPFAGVAVVPGFVSPQSSIQKWGPFLASHGIVTITIGTNAPTDQPPARAAALLDALETLKSEGQRAGGPLEGNIDEARLAIMGWSMGGGGTLIAANENPQLKAAISLCGWNPGGTYPMDSVPSMMFAGTADPLAGGQSQGFYQSIPDTTPKLLFEVNGGAHSVANDPAGQKGEIGRYGLSWMKVFLEGDTRYKQFLTQKPADASDFRTNVN
jgi:dienelactone hydrolase